MSVDAFYLGYRSLFLYFFELQFHFFSAFVLFLWMEVQEIYFTLTAFQRWFDATEMRMWKDDWEQYCKYYGIKDFSNESEHFY